MDYKLHTLYSLVTAFDYDDFVSWKMKDNVEKRELSLDEKTQAMFFAINEEIKSVEKTLEEQPSLSINQITSLRVIDEGLLAIITVFNNKIPKTEQKDSKSELALKEIKQHFEFLAKKVEEQEVTKSYRT